MGKPYGHTYTFAGSQNSAGTMICAGCHKPIDNKTQDWMHYTKPKNHDWGYVCWHRACRPDPKWEQLEAEQARLAAEFEQFKADYAALDAKYAHNHWNAGTYAEMCDEQELV